MPQPIVRCVQNPAISSSRPRWIVTGNGQDQIVRIYAENITADVEVELVGSHGFYWSPAVRELTVQNGYLTFHTAPLRQVARTDALLADKETLGHLTVTVKNKPSGSDSSPTRFDVVYLEISES